VLRISAALPPGRSQKADRCHLQFFARRYRRNAAFAATQLRISHLGERLQDRNPIPAILQPR
jgi:hypothetical protein